MPLALAGWSVTWAELELLGDEHSLSGAWAVQRSLLVLQWDCLEQSQLEGPAECKLGELQKTQASRYPLSVVFRVLFD